MSNKEIKIILEDEDGNREAVKLSDIPVAVWESFAKRASKVLETDDDKSAWGKIFAAVINSEFLVKEVIGPYIKSQRQGEYVFLLAGIPLQARDNFEMAASQANLTPDLIVALMYDSAMREQFHALSLKPIEEHEGNHTMFVSGITTETWAAWGEAADKLRAVTGEDVRPDNFLGFLLEKALWGEISITSNDPAVNDPKANEAITKQAEQEINSTDQPSQTNTIMELKRQVDEMMAKLEADNANKISERTTRN